MHAPTAAVRAVDARGAATSRERVRSGSTRVLVAALVAFAGSTIWYMAFAAPLTELGSAAAGPEPRPAAMAFVIAEHVVLGLALTTAAQRMGVRRWTGAALLAVATWVAFPLMVTTSSVVWENVPWRLAAIHAGDWLLKLLIISVIVVVWAERAARRGAAVSSGR